MRGLPEHLAEIVGSHLLVAGELFDTDPAMAYAHAEAARRRASRLPIVRQVAGETAYAAGEYASALNEFRALKRMTGTSDFLALAADCERGLGRPQAALAIVREGLAERPEPELRAELKIVEAGARADLGQRAEAIRVLQAELESQVGPDQVRARLAYAYADLVGKAGDEPTSLHWFERANQLDEEGETDASDRVDELQGMRIEINPDLLDDEDEDEPAVGEDESAPEESAPLEASGESVPDDSAPEESAPQEASVESVPDDSAPDDSAKQEASGESTDQVAVADASATESETETGGGADADAPVAPTPGR